jgi:hypothetical protein
MKQNHLTSIQGVVISKQQEEAILNWCKELAKENARDKADELFLSYWKERRKEKRNQ